MSEYTNTRPRRVYVPAAIGKEPTTPREALLSAAALLEEEGRWVQDVFYRNNADKTDEYVDDPWCNGWGTCAVGALQCVTLGVFKCDVPDYSRPFDDVAGNYPTSPKWLTDEDALSRFVDDYAPPGDWEDLTPAERICVEAHQLLDGVAAAGGAHEGIISLNDDMNTTRADVLNAFYAAAARAAELEAACSDG